MPRNTARAVEFLGFQGFNVALLAQRSDPGARGWGSSEGAVCGAAVPNRSGTGIRARQGPGILVRGPEPAWVDGLGQGTKDVAEIFVIGADVDLAGVIDDDALHL